MSLHPEAYYDVNNFETRCYEPLFTSLFGGADDAGVQLFAILFCGFTGIIIRRD